MNKKVEVPSMEAPIAPQKRRPGRPRKVQTPAAAKTLNVPFREVTLPLEDGDVGYCARHVEVQLTPAQARTMKRVLLGLQREGVTIGTRREPIKSAADVVRYVLDRLA